MKNKFQCVYAAGITAVLIMTAGCDNDKVSAKRAIKSEKITVIDFDNNTVNLVEPARKVVALAPHIVENVFSAGAGDTLVGVFEYSNYPDAAKTIPRVGGYEKTNIEAIVDINPDLILAWGSGNSHASINRLKELGFPVYIDEPKSLLDIAKSINDIGLLTGTSSNAKAVVEQYQSKLESLRNDYSTRERVSTFYQVWSQPLYTISGGHIINSAIELCGGSNIYKDEFAVSPVVSIESVLQRNPTAIVASGMDGSRPEWLDDWNKWESLRAVQENNLFYVNPDHIQRHTVRVLLGVESLCTQLDSAR